MNLVLASIYIPAIAGVICLLAPKRNGWIRETLTLLTSLILLLIGIRIFVSTPQPFMLDRFMLLTADTLSRLMCLAAGVFGFLLALYSVYFMRHSQSKSMYYSAFCWTLGASFGVILSNHLLLMLFFWGILALTLYMLILAGRTHSTESARKALIIVGGSDGILLLGIFCIYTLTSTFDMNQIILPLNGLAVFAFVCLGIAAFAKAGAMPLHSWIPDMASAAPVPATALMPASLDKLLGIYLLARMVMNLFQVSQIFNTALLILGSFTIIAAVMRALVQHDLKRLLAYHAVSQVGYMIVGLGTGNPIGMAGALFHMLNNTLYKTGLFLAGGAVESQTGTSDLDRLGGIGRLMPWTFITFLVSAFAISGIPPFNGFVSKWMIYQGLLKSSGDGLWVVWIGIAMFGSGLTLASFMKLNHAIFLGRPDPEIEKKGVREVSIVLIIPMFILAALCIGFGLFAQFFPLKTLFSVVTDETVEGYAGIWSPGFATIMVLLGLLIGLLIYGIGRWKTNLRESDTFIGGESLPAENRITGTTFYETIQSLPGIRLLYAKAEARKFDLYTQGSRWVLFITGIFRRAHTGVLTFYLVWALVGLMALLWLLGR
jgi:formate hydrogenlyase subunit 3/multisubunit Na+/H+ antiporter MnhD subunit